MCSKRTQLSAEPNILHTTEQLNLNRQSTKVPDLEASHVIHHFICTFGALTWAKRWTPRQWSALVVGGLDDSFFDRTENEDQKPGLVSRETSYDPRSPKWPRPSISGDHTNP